MVTQPQPTGPYTFEFVGGALCLDFTNSTGRESTHTNEHVHTFADLLDWGIQAEVLSPEKAEILRGVAADRPQEAEAVRVHALEVREMIYRIFLAGVRGEDPEPDDLADLNRELASAMTHSRVLPEPGGTGFRWGFEESLALDALLWPILRSAAELLASPELLRIKECGSGLCEWLFLDSTKNHRRRWCDMRSCGNRAKVRRHRQRKKEGS